MIILILITNILNSLSTKNNCKETLPFLSISEKKQKEESSPLKEASEIFEKIFINKNNITLNQEKKRGEVCLTSPLNSEILAAIRYSREKNKLHTKEAIDLDQAEIFFNERYQNLISNSYLNILIQERVEELIQTNQTQREVLKSNNRAQTIVIVGAGPVGLYQAIRLATLGYKVNIIEKRIDNPQRKQMFRYRQDLKKNNQIKELLETPHHKLKGNSIWKQLKEEGYITSNTQDPGDAEIFGNIGDDFETIPIYVQEIILRRFLETLSQHPQMNVNMYTGCQILSVDKKDIILEQNLNKQKKKAKISDVQFLIGASGPSGAVRKLKKNNKSQALTTSSQGLIFYVPNFFSPHPISYKNRQSRHSLFSSPGITQGESFTKILSGKYFKPRKTHTYHKYGNVFDPSNTHLETNKSINDLTYNNFLKVKDWPWNSGSSRFFLRLAEGSFSGENLKKRFHNFEKEYNIEDSTAELFPYKEEETSKQLTTIISQIKKTPLQPSLNEKEVELNLKDLISKYNETLSDSTKNIYHKSLQIFSHSNFEIEKNDFLISIRYLKDSIRYLKNLATASTHQEKKDSRKKALSHLMLFNKERESISKKITQKHGIKFKKELENLEELFSKRILEMNFHELNIPELIKQHKVDTENEYIKEYIKRYRALQFFFEQSFIDTVTKNDLWVEETKSLMSFGNFGGITQTFLNHQRPNYFFKRLPLGEILFTASLFVYDDLMTVLKELNWKEDRLPVVRLFNTNDIIYIGAEVPESLNQDELKKYLHILLQLYFPQEIVHLLMNISEGGEYDLKKNNPAFGSELKTFNIDIKQSDSSAGMIEEVPFFLVGDESVNAHYLTGSGAFSGWESAEHLCQLLIQTKDLTELQKKYQNFQDQQVETLIKKSEHIHLLKKLSPTQEKDTIQETQKDKNNFQVLKKHTQSNNTPFFYSA